MKASKTYLLSLIVFILVCIPICACAPSPKAEPIVEIEKAKEVSAEETPAPYVFPYGKSVDYVQVYTMGIDKNTRLPVDEAIQSWFADFVSRARSVEYYVQESPTNSFLTLHVGGKALKYTVWFDEQTGMFDSALHDDKTEAECWKLPEQTDYPLMAEVKRIGGELVLTRLPEGKALQSFIWNDNDVITEVQLRYTGNLEIWMDDERHIIEKNYEDYGYDGLPFTSIYSPKPILRSVIGRHKDFYDGNYYYENMLFLSHQTTTNGIGDWEGWQLFRIVNGELAELSIAPGHEDDLRTTVEVRGDDIFLVFPALERELPLQDDDFSWYDDYTRKDTLATIEYYKNTFSPEEMFTLYERPVYIEYPGYRSDRGPETHQITLWHGVNGPAHYYQGNVKVTYDITLDGLVPRWVKW